MKEKYILSKYKVRSNMQINDINYSSEKLERLRSKIFKCELKLIEFGFGKSRGIETYLIKEIKYLIKNSKESEEVMKIISDVVSLQEELYSELYKLGGMEKMDVDTFSPEKKILAIKEKILNPKIKSNSNLKKKKTQMSISLEQVLELLDSKQNSIIDKIMICLKNNYQRTYDHTRVIDYIIKYIHQRPLNNMSDMNLNDKIKFIVEFSKSKEFTNVKNKLIEERKKRK